MPEGKEPLAMTWMRKGSCAKNAMFPLGLPAVDQGESGHRGVRSGNASSTFYFSWFEKNLELLQWVKYSSCGLVMSRATCCVLDIMLELYRCNVVCSSLRPWQRRDTPPTHFTDEATETLIDREVTERVNEELGFNSRPTQNTSQQSRAFQTAGSSSLRRVKSL